MACQSSPDACENGTSNNWCRKGTSAAVVFMLNMVKDLVLFQYRSVQSSWNIDIHPLEDLITKAEEVVQEQGSSDDRHG